MSVKSVSILGVTGSVGKSTMEVIVAQPERFRVETVTANSNAELLAARARQLGARHAVISDEAAYSVLKDALAGTGIDVSAGADALLEASSRRCDIVMAAIVGFAGLTPLLAAIEAGSNVAVANKEPLVAAGSLVMQAAQKAGVHILPVDSEHNAVFQIFDEAQRGAVERILLTASGGPFLNWPPEQVAAATPEQAVAHPNWVMGRKISVDSATMMNKALEVIEAHYLFGLPAGRIDVVIHPQSVIHSMVEYGDGSVLAQMGAPDMCTPVAYCLGWPERIGSPGQRLDFSRLMQLELRPLDPARFPAVGMAYDCLAAGAAHCVAFNAANEVAVEAFLGRRIPFDAIIRTVCAMLDKTEAIPLKTVADIVTFNETVRERTAAYINSAGSGKNGVKGIIAA